MDKNREIMEDIDLHLEKMELEIDNKTYKVFFSESRISREGATGLYVYSIRHTDDDDTIPYSVENSVAVNRYGDIISEIPIPVPSVIDRWNFI